MKKYYNLLLLFCPLICFSAERGAADRKAAEAIAAPAAVAGVSGIDVRSRKKRQSEAVNADQRPCAGTAAYAMAYLNQMFTHGSSSYTKKDGDERKTIFYSDVYAAFPRRVEEIIRVSTYGSMVDEDADPSEYRFDHPASEGEDLLCNISEAERNVKKEIKSLVREGENATILSKASVGRGLHGGTSKDAWMTSCCKSVFHRSCIRHCKGNGVKKCPNDFCLRSWNDDFYSQMETKAEPVVKDVCERQASCSICQEPFFVESDEKTKKSQSLESFPSLAKRSKKGSLKAIAEERSV